MKCDSNISVEENGTLLSGIALCALLCAATLIMCAARGDLWLDEIHSLAFAEYAASPLDIFTKFKNDNNHILNTLYLYLAGQNSSFYTYRLLAVMSGIGSLLVLKCLSGNSDRRQTIFTLLFAGSSYPLVLYFSEARGYAPAIFFSLLAFMLAVKKQSELRLQRLLLFWAAAILGMLAHFTSIIILIALACSSLQRDFRSQPTPKRTLLCLSAWYGPPFAVFGVLYVIFVRPMAIGGGDPFSYEAVFRHTCSVVLGIPDGQVWGGIAIFCYCALIAAGTYLQFRQRSDHWLFYPLALFVLPLLMLAVTRPEVLYFRYFLVSFPFFYLLLGSSCTILWNSGRSWLPWTIAAAIVLMTAGHAARLVPLLTQGRGNYSAALSYMSASTPGPVIRAGSDHDYRNGMLLSYYARFLKNGKKIQYIEQKQMGYERPDWFILHSQDLSYRPQPALELQNIGNFRLVKQYPFAGESGWSWYIYQAQNMGTY